MKILWVKSDFLHPTERGGQIRTLETLRRLHARNELHYVAFDNPAHPEGLQRAQEYCTAAYAVEHDVPPRRSARFLWQASRNLLQTLPLSIARYDSPRMRRKIEELTAQHRFDAVVCDFLAMTPNFADLSRCVLFQHNVEYTIWERHAQHKTGAAKLYFQNQFERTVACEKTACQTAGHVIAVSEVDRDLMQTKFGVKDISIVPTGVDVEYFAPRESPPVADLVFVGAMDWMPNIDGLRYFTAEVLPLIRQRRPETTVVIAGRQPGPEIQALARNDSRIRVTGTVPDIRPYLWGSQVSIVPLRIGGGTRLKIYEAMAAGRPVVSTSIGAEGLSYDNGRNIHIADTAEVFADRCLELLEDAGRREQFGRDARALAERFSWESIAGQFEEILRRAPAVD